MLIRIFILVYLLNKKVKVTLTIDPIVVIKAKQIGLNLSQFCENALIKAIKALEPSNIDPKLKIKLLNQDSDKNKAAKWTGGDLNPRPPECKSGVRTS